MGVVTFSCFSNKSCNIGFLSSLLVSAMFLAAFYPIMLISSDKESGRLKSSSEIFFLCAGVVAVAEGGVARSLVSLVLLVGLLLLAGLSLHATGLASKPEF